MNAGVCISFQILFFPWSYTQVGLQDHFSFLVTSILFSIVAVPIYIVGILSLTSDLLGGEGRLDIECCRNSWFRDSESCWVAEYIKVLGGSHGPRRLGNTAALPPFLALCISFTWLLLSCVLYRKSVHVSEVFS